MSYTILRNNTQFVVNLLDLRSDDLVLSQDGYFYPVYSFPELNQILPKQGLDFSEIAKIVGASILITGGIVLGLFILWLLIQPRYNKVPLTKSTKNYIRERDEEICFYCDEYAPNRHVDHRISRYNGGSNEPENLTWACVSCNCSKGSMNDTEYIALIESYC